MTIVRKKIELGDPLYFCNKSWTLSYHVNAKAWISFHSYIPNWYIAENNFFYSGVNGCCDDIDFIVGVVNDIPDCELAGFAEESATYNKGAFLPPEDTTTTTSTTSTTSTSTTSTTTTSTTTIAVCTECAEYGYLYNRAVVEDVRQIANDGWHVPTYAEAITLFEYYDVAPIDGIYYNAGDQLKEAGLVHWDVPNSIVTTGRSGLNLRGGGERSQYDGTFIGLKSYHNWWCSTAGNIETYGDAIYVDKDSEYIWMVGLIASTDVTVGWGIRLIKDSTTLSHGQTGTYTGNDGKVYCTICIGTQEWVAEELCETQYRNHDEIPLVTDDVAWVNAVEGARSAYNNDLNNVGCGEAPTTTTTEVPTTTTTTTSTTTTTTTTTLDTSMAANCAGYAKFVDDGGYNSAGSNSSLDIPYPATVTSGNLLILSVASKSGATINTLSGWTELSAPFVANGSPTISSKLFYKIANGTEGGTNETVTFGSSSNVCGIICQYTDFNSASPFNSEQTVLNYISNSDSNYSVVSTQGCVVLGTIQLHISALIITITGTSVEIGANYIDNVNEWTIIETHCYDYYSPSSNSTWGLNHSHDLSYFVYQLNP